MPVFDKKGGIEIKQRLKNIPIFYQANAFLKARLQEKKGRTELEHYRRKASEAEMKLPEEHEALVQKLRQRLGKRGIHPIPKQKGALHVFLAYPLHNWEYILSIVLKAFGRVTEFEWISHGFDPKSDNWIEQRNSMSRAMLESFYKANSERPIDIVVGYLSGYVCDPEILREMAQAGAVIFNFNWDDKLGFRGKMLGGRWTGPAALASVVDLNLSNGPWILSQESNSLPAVQYSVFLFFRCQKQYGIVVAE